jgi:hypothetical protein
MVCLSEFQQCADILGLDIQVLCELRRAGVTGGGKYFVDFRALGQFPDQGVFPGAAADY